jgi:hypothetical protein
LETPSLNENMLLHEWKVSWNKIMKGIEILILKGFGMVYKCVKPMVRKQCGIIIIHRK